MNSAARKTLSGSGTEKIQKYVPLFLAAIIFCLYLPGNKEFFTLDDPQYVVNNELIKHFGFESIGKMFGTVVNGNYHPLTLLSLALDFKLHKLNPQGFYFTSILIHTLNSILLFFLILKLKGNTWIALLVSVLFAVHPMHVESVVWISERKDQLYVLFYFSALLFYLKYLNTSRQLKYLIYTGLFFLFSLLSKGQAVTLPLILILIDYLKERKINKISLYEKIPFLIMSFIFGCVAYYSQKNAGAVSFEIVQDISIPDRLILACFSLWNYFFKFLLPLKFSVLHPYPEKLNGAYPILVYLSPFLVFGLIGFIIWKWRSNKDVLFGLGFFLVNILLLVQLIPVGGAIVSERYSYLSYVGLFYLMSLTIVAVWEKSKNKILIGSILSCYGLFLVFTTYSVKRMWGSNKKLWSNVSGQYPNLAYAYLKLGFIYYRESENGVKKEKTDSASVNLNKAIALGWRSLDVYALRGDVNGWKGRNDSAISDYTKALSFAEDPLVRYHRGVLNTRVNSDPHAANYDSAIVDFKHMVKTNPDEGIGYVYLGDIYLNRGKKDTAFNYYRQAMNSSLEPGIKHKLEELLLKDSLDKIGK